MTPKFAAVNKIALLLAAGALWSRSLDIGAGQRAVAQAAL